MVSGFRGDVPTLSFKLRTSRLQNDIESAADFRPRDGRNLAAYPMSR